MPSNNMDNIHYNHNNMAVKPSGPTPSIKENNKYNKYNNRP